MSHPKISQPCPFCGAKGTELELEEEHRGNLSFAVLCTNCHAKGPTAVAEYESQPDWAEIRSLAVFKWNAPMYLEPPRGDSG